MEYNTLFPKLIILKKSFIQFMYMSIQCLICKKVVITIQWFFPIFPYIILPFIVNWWYIYSLCHISKVIRGGVIIIWLTGKITIWFNSFWSVPLMCSCVFNSNIFDDLLSIIDIKFYLQNQYNYQETYLMIEIEYCFWLKNNFGQCWVMKTERW